MDIAREFVNALLDENYDKAKYLMSFIDEVSAKIVHERTVILSIDEGSDWIFEGDESDRLLRFLKVNKKRKRAK